MKRSDVRPDHRPDHRPMRRVVHLPASNPSDASDGGRGDVLAVPRPESDTARNLNDFWEFLAADFDPAYASDVPAAAGDAARRPRSQGPDPEFRERLREQLWRLVQRRRAAESCARRDSGRSH